MEVLVGEATHVIQVAAVSWRGQVPMAQLPTTHGCRLRSLRCCATAAGRGLPFGAPGLALLAPAQAAAGTLGSTHSQTWYRTGEDESWHPAEIDFERSVCRVVFGVEVPVIPRENLLSYKRRIGRDVDIEDLTVIDLGE